MMVYLQNQGCHNINLITPTHEIPHILAALVLAAQRGLRLPLVYKSSGYECVTVLHDLLDGVIDIYMPDLKYADEATARDLSGVPNYPMISQEAVIEMHRQVGDLQCDSQGIAQRGLIVAHLVLPGGAAGTETLIPFIRDRLSPHTWLSLPRYIPAFEAAEHPSLQHAIHPEAYQRTVTLAIRAGLTSAARYRAYLSPEAQL